MALRDGAIDPVAFTSLRLLSGALVLFLIVFARSRSISLFRSTKWQPALALFIYGIAFSLAYLSLDAGTGALLLFAAVQVTMIGIGLLRGNRLNVLEWTGVIAAMVGLTYLLSPGLSAPPMAGAILMLSAGIAWGLYSLLGQGEPDPIDATARNFVLAAPLALLLCLAPSGFETLTTEGIALALLSGIVTSGLGYVIWYAALRGLTTTVASIVQLTVPAIAAFAGILLLGETLSLRFLLASTLIIGGIFTTILAGRKA